MELTPAYIEKHLVKALDDLGLAIVPKSPTGKQIKAMQEAMPSCPVFHTELLLAYEAAVKVAR